jgi:Transglutaminase-like superfamily
MLSQVIPRNGRRERRQDIQRQLAQFLLGDEPFPQESWVKNRELLPALIPYARAVSAFRRSGLQAALGVLPAVNHRAGRSAITTATEFCARAATWRILGLARTAGRRLCLDESLGVCAALRSLGFPIQVVIGYPVIEPPDGKEELHAWPALGEAALIRWPAPAFVQLVRYPADRDAARATPSQPGSRRTAHPGGVQCS